MSRADNVVGGKSNADEQAGVELKHGALSPRLGFTKVQALLEYPRGFLGYVFVSRSLFYTITCIGFAVVSIVAVREDVPFLKSVPMLAAQGAENFDVKLELVYKKKTTPNDVSLKGLDILYNEGIPIIARSTAPSAPTDLDITLANALEYFSRHVGIFAPPASQTDEEFSDRVTNLKESPELKDLHLDRPLIINALIAMQQDRMRRFTQAIGSFPPSSEGGYIAWLLAQKRVKLGPAVSPYRLVESVLNDYDFTLQGEPALPAVPLMAVLKTHLTRKEVPILFRGNVPYVVAGYIAGVDATFLIVHEPESAMPRDATASDFIEGSGVVAENLRARLQGEHVRADWLGGINKDFQRGIHVRRLSDFTTQRGFILSGAVIQPQKVRDKLHR